MSGSLPFYPVSSHLSRSFPVAGRGPHAPGIDPLGGTLRGGARLFMLVPHPSARYSPGDSLARAIEHRILDPETKEGQMAQAKNGDTVKVHYTGKLDDGSVFDSSADRDPLEFTLGKEQVIPGFEKAIVGMNPGDSRTATIPADDAYGPHRKEMVMEVGRDQFPPDLEPQVGQQIQIKQPDGHAIAVMVTQISGSKVTLDANHPLAGKDLTFDINLVSIQ